MKHVILLWAVAVYFAGSLPVVSCRDGASPGRAEPNIIIRNDTPGRDEHGRLQR